MSTENTTQPGLSSKEALTLIDASNIEALLAQHQQQLAALPKDADPVQRASLQLDIASDLLGLQRQAEAWQQARPIFDVFVQHAQWQHAVETCDVIYQCGQPDAIIALGNGVWLGVTFPIAANTSVAMLHHIIDETPANADGAAVAAIAAHYIADLRCQGQEHTSLTFLTNQVIAQVAKRHSQIESQDMLNFWMERLQLKDPAIFLPRMAKILDAIVEDNWWFNRDALRKQLPIN